jgi:hypothetical protein
MSAQLAPAPVFRSWDNLGLPLVGGKLNTYAAGTTTRQATYTDSTQTTPNTNPVILNFRGEAFVWLDPTLTYKFVLTDAFGNLIWTEDNIPGGVDPFPANDVRSFGAKFDGVTDDWSAWTAALNSGFSVIIAPAGNSFLSQGIIVPPNVMIVGAGCLPGNPVGGGTVLIFAASISALVTLGNSSANSPLGLQKLSILREGGEPPANSIGVYVNGGYNIILSEVAVYNCAQNWYFKAYNTGVGLGAHCDKIFSGQASDAHLVMDTWPELTLVNCRFGMDGSGDYAGNCHIRITGGAPGTASGPNTLKCIACQFNQGSSALVHALEFVNLVGTVPTTDASNFTFDSCHFENVSSAFVYSDATWNIIDRLMITNCVFNNSIPMFALNSGSAPSEWQFIGNDIFASDITLAPTGQISAVEFSSNRIKGTMSLTGVAGSTLTMADNSHGGNVTVAGTWGYLKLSGSFTAGSLIWSSAVASLVWLEGGFSFGTYTPQLNFGGAHVGLTFTLQQGRFQVLGNRIRGDFAMTISNIGSSTGPATITGLPYPVVNAAVAIGGGGVCTYATPMVGISGVLLLNAVQNAATLNIYQMTSTGVSVINQGSFGTPPVTIAGTFDYEWQ